MGPKGSGCSSLNESGNRRTVAGPPSPAMRARPATKRCTIAPSAFKVARSGELLKEIDAAKNQHDAAEPACAGARTRTQTAAEAGLSHHQRNTALRLASIPPAEFEAAVESDKRRR
jgi:hypothetical protein